MPEGDTLHRIAARIGPVLTDGAVTSLSLADRGEMKDARGWIVTGVRALGKHLLIAFDVGWTLRAHLGMNGRVFVARSSRRLPAHPTFLVRVQGTEDARNGEVTVACVRAYRAELLRSTELSRHARLARLGPDLLADPVDLDGVLERALDPAHGAREVADVLLDQRIAAGIGNVYKSEVLFVQGIHPRTPMAALDAESVRVVYQRATELMRRNLRTRRRTTVPTRRRPYPNSPRLWVYERTGEPCLDCGTPIRRFTQGEMARGTWYCPSCQPEPPDQGRPVEG